MTISELRNYCTILRSKISTFRSTRVESAYEDLFDLAALAEEIEASVADRDVFQLTEAVEYEEASFVVHRHHQIVTLLKALYIFSDVYISIMVSELIDKPGITLNKFLSSEKHPLTNFPMDKILPAYCVVAYRNKVIAHHDVRRMPAHIMGPKSGQHRLVPMSERFYISESSVAELARLKSSYVDRVPELKNENNHFEQLKILFYNIPVGEFGNINADRKKIDRIAEQGGCNSMTCNEIMKALDAFTEAAASWDDPGGRRSKLSKFLLGKFTMPIRR
jgi:hypothetical protein